VIIVIWKVKLSLSLQELSNHLEQLYATFEREQNEVAEWMNGAQTALSNVSNTLVLNDNSSMHSQLQVSL